MKNRNKNCERIGHADHTIIYNVRNQPDKNLRNRTYFSFSLFRNFLILFFESRNVEKYFLKSGIFKKEKFLPLCRIPNNLMTPNAQVVFGHYHFYHYTSNILLFPDCSTKNWIVLLDFLFALLSKHNSAYWWFLFFCNSCYNDCSRTFADFANDGSNAIIHFASFQIMINVKISHATKDLRCILYIKTNVERARMTWQLGTRQVFYWGLVCVCSAFGLSSSFCGQSMNLEDNWHEKKTITSCHEKKQLPPAWKKLQGLLSPATEYPTVSFC